MRKDERQNDAIKKENKKALKVFIPVLIVAGLVGGLFGYFSQTEMFQNFSGNIGELAGELVYQSVPYLMILTEVVVFALSLVYYKRGKRDFAAYEAMSQQMESAAAAEQDEDALDAAFEKADRSVGTSMVILGIGMIVSFMFFGVFMCNLIRMLDEGRFILPSVVILVFLAGMFVQVKMQQLSTDLVKKMNPKLRGSVYDLNFSKKWTASCDEAEMMTIYKASYRGFQTANVTCVVLWVVFCLGDMMLHYGSLPVIAISIIWLVMSASYYIESFHLEYGKNTK